MKPDKQQVGTTDHNPYNSTTPAHKPAYWYTDARGPALMQRHKVLLTEEEQEYLLRQQGVDIDSSVK